MRTLIFLAMLSPIMAASQDTSPGRLARLLASPNTRREAVAQVVNSAPRSIATLLSWIESPPAEFEGGTLAQLHRAELHIGMADAFGELRSREAIPFLIKYINLRRSLFQANIWMKAESIRVAGLPAVAALIKIGPDASQPLIDAYFGPMTLEDRKAVVFTIAMIKDPQNRGFLEGVAVYGKEMRSEAEDALKLLDEQR